MSTLAAHPPRIAPTGKEWTDARRLGGLRRFGAAITIFTILGHTVFGFEQSWLTPFVGAGTAILLELLLELVDARVNGRAPRYRGRGIGGFVDFILSAHISGLAVAMLLYPNERLAPVAFAAAVAIGSKAIVRVPVGGRSRHVLNPSNFGITLTLLLFPWVGIAPPYHFTENLTGIGDWILPAVIIVSGSFLNLRFTGRIPLLLAWVVVFFLQALARSVIFGTPLPAPWLPMTGVAFILFTFYMVTDPATTPSRPAAQVAFGAAVALAYGALMASHVVFGLFFALSIVAVGRGAYLAAVAAWAAVREEKLLPELPLTRPSPLRGEGLGIAIVGMACRYPDARSPEELWENVLAGRRSFRRLPDERLRSADYFAADPAAPDRTYSMRGAVLEGWSFDRVAYRVSAEAFRAADLAHWLALDVASSALRDAGFANSEGLPRATTGVHLGNTLTGEFSRAATMRLRWPYVRRVADSRLRAEGWPPDRRAAFLAEMEEVYKRPFAPVGNETLAGGLSNTIAGRICNHFDLNGGGHTVDGACASSLLSVVSACTALRAGDLDVAIAGGVDLSLDPFELVGFAKTGALAADEMRVYDERSAGFWPGEGCGMLVLMRAEDAIRAGRRIHAIIRGWGVSSDGSGGITRPDQDGQLLALRRAYERAGFGAEAVSYFEGHGTGTRVGDATELDVLSAARREADGAAPPAVIGSIKANIGHTKAAAGAAGLIKATMAVARGVIPPTTGCERPASRLREAGAVLRIARRSEPWPGAGPRRAAVSSMGFGGINTHLVLESAAPVTAPYGVLPRPAPDAELIPLAAASRASLLDRAAHLESYASRLSLAEVGDLAAQLAREVEPMPQSAAEWRAALVASSPDDLARGLAALRTWLEAAARPSSPGDAVRIDETAGVMLAVRPRGAAAPRIALAFPGQGAPTYRDGGAMARHFAPAGAIAGAMTLPDGADDASTAVAQPAIAAASIAAARVLAALGVDASIAIGHSLGEITALAWAGAFDDAALLEIAAARGRAMAACTAVAGAMASVGADPQRAAALIAGTAGLVIAGFNGPQQTTVSGPVAAVEALVERARRAGVRAARLPVAHAFHSPLVAPARAALAADLAARAMRPLARPIASTVTGAMLDGATDVRALLLAQVVSPVRFTEAAALAIAQSDLVIEAGPGAVLAGLLRGCGAGPVVSTDAGGPSLRGLLTALGAAYVLGAPVRLGGLAADRVTRPFDLDWRPSFLASPCEQAPADEDASELAAAAVVAAPPAPAETAPRGSAPRDVFRALVAAHADLPLESVRDGDRLLGDLHLNSLTVGALVVQACRSLGLPPPVSPTDYAAATVAEVATALDTIAASGAAPSAAAPIAASGVAPWVRAFTVEPIEVERAERANGEAHVAAPPSAAPAWRVVAHDPERAEIRRALAALEREVAGTGVLVWLGGRTEDADATLLLDGARAALASAGDARLVLVPNGRPGASVARTLHLEERRVAVCVVDGAEPAADLVAAEAAACRGYSEARLDDAGVRREPRLHLDRLPEEGAPIDLSAADLLLVTGGGRGIAAECALAIARRTGARLLLAGRADPARDETLARNLERLRRAGADARYIAMDVTSAAEVAAALRAAQRDAGPITAVLHGAGVNEPLPLRQLTPRDFARTAAPKLDGLANVLAAIDPSCLRTLVTFGSIIARIGLPGEADYALANERLGAAVARWAAAHPRCRCLNVEWSIWSGTGMGERLGRVDALAHQGVTAITVEQGTAILLRLLGAGGPTGSIVVTGRFGAPPTLSVEERDLPILRFLERARVHVPGVEIVADTEVSIASDPYVEEHVFHGRRLLPAVVGLEAMAQVAAAVAGRPDAPIFESVEFRRPIEVPASGAVTVRCAALAADGGAVDVLLRSSETEFQVDHFRATARWGPAPRPPAWAASEEARRGAIGAPRLHVDPAHDLYGAALFQEGRFRRVRAYRRLRARECVAELVPCSSACPFGEPWFGAYLPPDQRLGDPAARDAMIHAIQACIPHRTLLPIAAERISIGPGAAGARFVHAVERERDGATFVYDVVAMDADGAIVEQWEGLQLRAVDESPHPREWPAPLLAAYLERRAAEVLPGTPIAVAARNGDGADRTARSAGAIAEASGAIALHRPDGKPVPATGRGGASAAHAGDVTIAVAGADPIACDLEPLATRSESMWRDLLGAERFALAGRVAAASGEDHGSAATRVWAAAESLKKAGVPAGAPLVLESVAADGWIALRSGPLAVVTCVAAVRGAPAPLAIALLAPARPDLESP
jgi:enediyne polyketide synthase